VIGEPVNTLWGVVLLTPLLRHTKTEDCLAELGRNQTLRRLIGIESEAALPMKWNVLLIHSTIGKVISYLPKIAASDSVTACGS
jgi:hypothetical protein